MNSEGNDYRPFKQIRKSQKTLQGQHGKDVHVQNETEVISSQGIGYHGHEHHEHNLNERVINHHDSRTVHSNLPSNRQSTNTSFKLDSSQVLGTGILKNKSFEDHSKQYSRLDYGQGGYSQTTAAKQSSRDHGDHSQGGYSQNTAVRQGYKEKYPRGDHGQGGYGGGSGDYLGQQSGDLGVSYNYGEGGKRSVRVSARSVRVSTNTSIHNIGNRIGEDDEPEEQIIYRDIPAPPPKEKIVYIDAPTPPPIIRVEYIDKFVEHDPMNPLPRREIIKYIDRIIEIDNGPPPPPKAPPIKEIIVYRDKFVKKSHPDPPKQPKQIEIIKYVDKIIEIVAPRPPTPPSPEPIEKIVYVDKYVEVEKPAPAPAAQEEIDVFIDRVIEYVPAHSYIVYEGKRVYNYENLRKLPHKTPYYEWWVNGGWKRSWNPDRDRLWEARPKLDDDNCKSLGNSPLKNRLNLSSPSRKVEADLDDSERRESWFNKLKAAKNMITKQKFDVLYDKFNEFLSTLPAGYDFRAMFG